ncbi:MAG: general secretion pathway protein GspK [Thermoguttaceae bacterium]|nr:general secretion pathway protein GspK [Thermoguttaceae bacterium]
MMTRVHDLRKPVARRGMVLLVVLVVIALLAMAALGFTELMLSEREAAELSVRQAQARACADSGLEFARSFLMQDAQTMQESGGWYDNMEQFRGVLVRDGLLPKDRGRFSIVAPAQEDGRFAGIRFGLEDESGRLNLNTLLLADRLQEGSARQILMGLPGMTEDVADAILDWIDPDPEPREFGAEAEYYGALNPPYAPKNGPLETIEELLLVRGVTPQLLFGADANRNGMIDAGEPDPQSFIEADNSDGSMDRGWSAYLTLWSLESNLRPDGTPKINLNQDDLEKLYNEVKEAINEAAATYVVAWRQTNQAYTGDQQPTTQYGELDFEKKSVRTFANVLDLIGDKIEVQFKNENQKKVIESPFPNVPLVMNSYIATLMDNLTVQTAQVLPGRINVNQAPRAVLLGIPGMTEDIVDQIIAQRQPDPAQAEPHQKYETWLLSEGIVDLQTMRALMPFVCGSGSVYRAQVVGYFDREGPDARIEAILDATKSRCRIVFWRDMTHLGRGYSREMLGIEAAE